MLRLAAICFLAAFAALPDGAAAQGRECDAIRDDHAYNQCLAASGPARRASRPATASQPSARGARSQQRGGMRGGLQVQRLKGGRVRMILPARALR